MDPAEFAKQPLLGILRGIGDETIEPLTGAIISAGLRTVEITMNTPQAPRLIRRMRRCSKGHLMIGAGTVLTADDVRKAADAGATFVVSPILVPAVMRTCAKLKLPAFPGALTPREIYEAWRAGATMVKVFPAKCFGPEYFKEICGPFKQIKLLACGGVNAANLKTYLNSGADAAAFGASVFKSSWIKEKNFKAIEREIAKLLRVLG